LMRREEWTCSQPAPVHGSKFARMRPYLNEAYCQLWHHIYTFRMRCTCYFEGWNLGQMGTYFRMPLCRNLHQPGSVTSNRLHSPSILMLWSASPFLSGFNFLFHTYPEDVVALGLSHREHFVSMQPERLLEVRSVGPPEPPSLQFSHSICTNA
jgi:hypothetical protein